MKYKVLKEICKMDTNTTYVQISVEEYKELIKAKYALQLISETRDSYGYTTSVIDTILRSFEC